MQRTIQAGQRVFSRTLATRIPAEATETIAGTAPVHNAYLFLRAPSIPREFPSKLTSPLYNSLLLKLAPHPCPVNWAWYGAEGIAGQNADAILFQQGLGQLVIPKLTEENIEEVVEHLERGLSPADRQKDDIHLLVCTHTARDCRCGDIGGPFTDALKAEIRRRGVERVHIAETGHVGGHKYVFPMLSLKLSELIVLPQTCRKSSCISTRRMVCLHGRTLNQLLRHS
jgi:hypothetical protein